MSSEFPIDSKGRKYTKPAFWLDPQEYSKIKSEINLIYDVKYKGKRVCAHTSFGIDGFAYVYWFENHEFDEYNIFQRVFDKH